MNVAGLTGVAFFLDQPELQWQRRAECAKDRPDEVKKVKQRADRFFPQGRPSRIPKATCLRCDVREQCLQWALEHDESGTWGGLSDRERQAIKDGAR